MCHKSDFLKYITVGHILKYSINNIHLLLNLIKFKIKADATRRAYHIIPSDERYF